MPTYRLESGALVASTDGSAPTTYRRMSAARTAAAAIPGASVLAAGASRYYVKLPDTTAPDHVEMTYSESSDDRFAKLRASQAHDPEAVADGLIGLATALERMARSLKANAREVRNGRYLADFAYSNGRDVKYRVADAIAHELPDEDDLAAAERNVGATS